ncbi:MAG: thioredoxin family protein [Cryomorphaceae bacterium]|nr:thioredoxin family protein [Cryomorphaceae bacterium]MBT3503892.1 thioredoxin family protein [Cryomorphaceae bacterium]MBT3689070.1 thioredoxin family protein [Cryomorphaceae bacterium]MBT4221923.1 thioredoxin family protein [Cryomorphaceae bacterium]MBT4237108.1 thioredoxin family protein [Cryomorphaceae bacterium]
MARTPSNMISLGSVAPDFYLLDVTSDSNVSLTDTKGNVGTVIMFICNHCPYVKHVNPTISRLAKDHNGDDIKFIAISSNDVINYPDDSPEKMKINAIENDFNFPYLYDETQETAKEYDAACTPDFYLYDSDLKLVYRGQLDNSRPGNNIESDGSDMENAIKCLKDDIKNEELQKPSIGCNIKWK